MSWGYIETLPDFCGQIRDDAHGHHHQCFKQNAKMNEQYNKNNYVPHLCKEYNALSLPIAEA